MKGLVVNRDVVGQVPIKGYELLASYKDAVVMVYKLKKNRKIYYELGEEKDALGFIYIIEGKLRLTDQQSKEEIILSGGDTFYGQDKDMTICIDVVEDVSLLYFTIEDNYKVVDNRLEAIQEYINQIQDKDEYTADHCYRVAVYAEILAEHVKGITYSNANLYYAATMHDVGKCKIPDAILKKKGRFTEEERVEMNAHPVYSSEMLAEGNGFNEHICKIVATHHERYDGTGYPQGLKGEEIPVEARMIAIADTFDAITSDRPYQRARTIEEAIEEMVKYRSQFDPKLFEVFLDLAKSGQLDPNHIPLIKNYKKKK